MAALPSPTQVAGDHSAIYEAYYNAVDPNGSGSVGGMEAARFLKKSGLSDVILSRIWDLSDPKSRGCLDKNGMFVALKLVALVQNGKDLSLKSINDDVPPPKLGDVPLPKPSKPPPPQKNQSHIITSMAPPPPPPVAAASSSSPSPIDWNIKPNEKEKYDKLFDSLQPSNGLIAGNKVKNVLMESKLPFDTLGKIWDLADQDKDGMLNRHEFVVAMHLVYKALEKYTIPNELPQELKKPTLVAPSSNNLNILTKLTNVNDGIIQMNQSEGVAALSTATIKPMPPTTTTTTTSVTHQQHKIIDWVVSDEEKAKSDVLFLKSDIDKDGFVSGQEIKDVFLQSGVPQPVLAHIWALCDIKQMGKLNNEQFALAMWLVARCLKGIEPPPALTPEMVPPTFRTIKQQQQQQLPIDSLVENNNTRYSNPELDMITKDIEDLAREKLLLETDIAQKEADIKIKSGEIKSLQSELDTLAATLKQLENQKGEAQKRLNDLKLQVDKLRVQAAEQADLVKAQEMELNIKKEQLEGLKNEEEKLEKLKEENVQKIDNLNKNLQNTQLNISQSKALITQLQEQTRQMKDAIKSCDAAIESGDLTPLPDAALRIKPEFRDVEFNKFHNVINNGHSNTKMNGHDDDPFGGSESESANFATSSFNDDPFKEDPFNNKNDPFNSAFPHSTTTITNAAFASDPFGNTTNNNNNSSSNGRTRDAFEDTFDKPTSDQEDNNKDAFGCDPFAILHAPTRDGGGAPPRPTSPTPALPPKKSKQPPPRPAPPRPALPPAAAAKKPTSSSESFDPFGCSSSAVGGEFADFSNFDAKFEEVDNKISTRLDFHDDPFRDYRYEDPFDITFDDFDDGSNNNNEKIIITTTRTSNDPFRLDTEDNSQRIKKDSHNNNNKNNDFDPFNLITGRQSVPLLLSSSTSSLSNNNNNVNDPFSLNNGRSSVPLINTNNNNNNSSKRLPSEDEQLMWANRESLRLEEERKFNEIKEKADLQLAITLSKNHK